MTILQKCRTNFPELVAPVNCGINAGSPTHRVRPRAGGKERAVHLEKTFTVNASDKKVLGAIRNPELIEESERSRDALAVKIDDVIKTDAAHTFVICVTQYAMGARGVDKSKTEDSETTVTWDLNRARGTWVWKGSGLQSKLAKVSGGYELTAKGKQTEMKLWTDVEIPIPVLGKVIMKKVAKGFEENWPPYVARVERWANKS
jgi:hypothetical protein